MISYSFLERGGGAALQFPLSFDTLKSDFLYRNIKAWFSNNSFFFKKKTTSFKQKYWVAAKIATLMENQNEKS